MKPEHLRRHFASLTAPQKRVVVIVVVVVGVVVVVIGVVVVGLR